eukprot:15473296-Alexandrium_andersonii.AAC.1
MHSHACWGNVVAWVASWRRRAIGCCNSGNCRQPSGSSVDVGLWWKGSFTQARRRTFRTACRLAEGFSTL